jgi:transcriptional regulator with XRE-family HTH domain
MLNGYIEHAQHPAGVAGADTYPSRRKGSAPMTENESKAAAADLAKRLRLLLDVAIAESGIEPTYSQIAAYLGERGTNLSRSRWTYMVNGHRYVQDPEVFEGLASFFDVDADFLIGSDGAEVPARVSAQLDLVRSMRAAKVKSYAARTLGDISPKALQAISRFLDEEMAHTIEQ